MTFKKIEAVVVIVTQHTKVTPENDRFGDPIVCRTNDEFGDILVIARESLRSLTPSSCRPRAGRDDSEVGLANHD